MAPAFLLAALIASGIGLAYAVWRGGSLTQMALFVLAAWVGFALGQLLGSLFGLHLLLLGEVHWLEGSLGSLLVLVLVHRPAAG